MRNLNEILNESIFDKNVAGGEDSLMKEWLDARGIKPTDASGPSVEIDEKNKTIKFIDTKWSTREVGGISITGGKQAFDGFIPGWRFIDVNGKDIVSWEIHGKIKGFKGAPAMENISIYADDADIDSNVYKDISSQFKKLKEVYFYSRTSINTFSSLDLSELKTQIRLLYIGNVADGGIVKFNPDLKVETLQIGYGAIDASVKNLPIVKTLSFKSADFESIRKMIEGLEDKGKSNFKSVVISCRDCNNEEKEAIKSLLQGQDTGFVGFGDLVKKLKVLNSNQNLDDPTKDLFGCPLQAGDVVLVADAANPKWPSILDVYKGATSGGRVRTETRMQVPPRNIIKINNPKILELIK
jgi:hypothetical protein